MKTLLLSTMITLVIIPAGSLALAQSAGSSVINGHIVDDGGKAVAGASIQFSRVYDIATLTAGPKGTTSLPPSSPSDHGVVTSDATGQFNIANLSMGSYMLCANVPGSTYLDPCDWSQPIRVSVGTNATKTRSISLTTGVLLNVRINDPDGLLGLVTNAPMTRAKLLVGVIYGAGAYQSATIGNADTSGRNYTLAIPAGVPFNLRLFSHDIALTQQGGMAVDTSGAHTIQLQGVSGQNESFIFTASAVK